MKKIYRDNTHSLTVGESKRLIIGALPTELGVPVFASRNEQGEIVVDSVTIGEPVNTCFQAGFIDIDFLPICLQQGITPRHKYRPVFTDYPGTVEQDAYYTITHDEFVKLAKLYDTTVEIETAPAQSSSSSLAPKPVQRSAAQDAAILSEIASLGLNAQALPKNKPVKPGVKAQVRSALVGVSSLFPKSGKQFDHAWDRLRARKELADQA